MSIQSDPLEAFSWQPQPEAQRVLCGLVDEFMDRCPAAGELAEKLKQQTGTRFFDWIDHIVLPRSAEIEHRLTRAGFSGRPLVGAEICFVNEAGMFPRLVLGADAAMAIGIKVESVADFLAANGLDTRIEGEPLGAYRRARAFGTDQSSLWVIERHGYDGFDLPPAEAHAGIAVLRHLETFRMRRRMFPDESEGFSHAARLIDAAVGELGASRACDAFFAAEREYWMRHNRAAQVQYARQQRMGLGWANHDHHTYRSSRRHFTRLIGLWEKLGFTCRERYHAGMQAGWGAQIMEHPTTGVVTFNDVDLAPDELFVDFAHESLPERRELGTVGLWCALHGESALEAGMHHLECQFDFESLRTQLEAEAGVKTMRPFTDLPHLRQAFTEGERWPVREERIARLLERGQISAAQAATFRTEGAIGSHLENLERNDGFKGFNQKGVSEIIAATDPRRAAAVTSEK